MGRVLVHGATLQDGRISSMEVQLGSLPRRTIDRDTAVRWMRDLHSFVPVTQGKPGAALQLVELDAEDGPAWFIRTDNAAEPADRLPNFGR